MARSSRRRPLTPAVESATTPVFEGGRYQPLTDSECDQIIDSSLDILQGIGIADAPGWLQRLMLEKGASLRQDGRLTFARGAVEKASSTTIAGSISVAVMFISAAAAPRCKRWIAIAASIAIRRCAISTG
jgi:trimethylamine:corrinoid methyltransferase-like protein